MQPDAWETFFQPHQRERYGSRQGLRLAGFGAFVELAEGVEGLCHFSEVPGWTGRKSDRRRCRRGQEADFKIIRMNEAERKIGLSLKAVADAEERDRLEDYQRQAAAATSTIEEVMSRPRPRDQRSDRS